MRAFSPSRTLAVAERDLRRFRRNSTLLIPMVLMPIIYLVILGKSMGGDLHHVPVAVVMQDRGAAANLVANRLGVMAQSRELFRLSGEPDPRTAVDRLRAGAYKGVVIIPPGFSEHFTRGEPALLGVVVDNTDNTSAAIIEGELRNAMLTPGISRETGAAVTAPGIQVERVDVYGHKDFMQYLVPGVIALALFFVDMLAGGLILVDDRAKGIHEGYFVTPLSSLDVVLGLTLSALTLSMIIGSAVLVAAITIARVQLIGGLSTLLLSETCILLLALGLVLFMFTLMARVSNPLTPRALFGILNVITFFPSGALYPTESYPAWLNAISRAFPMRYAVHALRGLLLKGVGFPSVAQDFLVMGAFAGTMLILASTLFKRTL